MMRKRLLLVLSTIGLCLCQACDKYLKLQYQVHNKTGRPVELVVEQPQTGYAMGDLKTDTIVRLQEDSVLTVGYRTEIRSGFDSTTNWLIYDNYPGMQNFSVWRSDSIIPNADSNWSYQDGAAHFFIQPGMFE